MVLLFLLFDDIKAYEKISRPIKKRYSSKLVTFLFNGL